MSGLEITDAAPAVTIQNAADTLTVEFGPALEISPSGVSIVQSPSPAVRISEPDSVLDLEVGNAVRVTSVVGAARLPPPEDLTFSYDAEGRISTITGETYTRTLTYDVLDRVSTITDSDTGVVQKLTYDATTGLPAARDVS